MKYITTINEIEYLVELIEPGVVRVNDEIYHVDFEEIGNQDIFSLLINGKSFEAHLSENEKNKWNVQLQGALYEVNTLDEREKRLTEAAGYLSTSNSKYMLKSPMPGLISNIPVKLGDKIETGDVLIILESMKMQNELKSPQDGLVTEIRVSEGANVEQKEVLLVIDPLEE